MARNRAGFLGCITALKKVSNCPTLAYESAMTGEKQVCIVSVSNIDTHLKFYLTF